jgi:hypothetical protein
MLITKQIHIAYLSIQIKMLEQKKEKLLQKLTDKK